MIKHVHDWIFTGKVLYKCSSCPKTIAVVEGINDDIKDQIIKIENKKMKKNE